MKADRLNHSSGDGAYSATIYRPLSQLIGPRLASRVSANLVTAVGLGCGTGAGVLVGYGMYLAGGICLAVFLVLDSVDGLVARLRNESSQAGAFLDGVVDKVVECAAASGAFLAAAQVSERVAFLVWPGYLIGILGLTFMADKFRMVAGHAYPKHAGEIFFPWLTSGGEARMSLLVVLFVLGAICGSPVVIYWGLMLQTGLIMLNCVYRCIRGLVLLTNEERDR